MYNKIYLPNIYILGNGEETMKIKKMTIDNICGIKHLDLNFNEGLNLICGENGVGKTTILKSIAYPFSYGENDFIKKHYGTGKGHVGLWFTQDKKPISYDVVDFKAGTTIVSTEDFDRSNQIIYFSPSRKITYNKVKALKSSETIDTDELSFDHSPKQLISGVNNDIKNWFVTNYAFSAIENSLNEYEIFNFELSKRVFNMIDNDLSVKTVKKDFEIVLNHKNKEIYFEMLSDGYKSCIFVLLNLIKEISYRFPAIKAEEFSGVIMIDEIDLHLHPQWQSKLVNVLKDTFPKAQIIATTHSPSVLQNAQAKEIIPLYIDREGNVNVNELSLGEYGLQGWTLEEIMKDVMGMDSTTSELYTQVINDFDKAMGDENVGVAKEKYNLLCQMLHPNNPLRQLMQIQMAGMGEQEND